MFVLASIFLLHFTSIRCYSSAKVFLTELKGNDVDQDVGTKDVYLPNNNSGSNEKLWVLDFDEGVDTLKLRRGTAEDEMDFEFYTRKLIMDYLKKQSALSKSNVPQTAKPTISNSTKTAMPVVKEDIFRYLNKFALYSKTEPDAYLSDSHEQDDPSIAVYFKGQFTSLIVKLGIRQWHYFIEPSLVLPSWFYDDHKEVAQDGTVVLPENVKVKFYSALMRVLQVVLRQTV